MDSQDDRMTGRHSRPAILFARATLAALAMVLAAGCAGSPEAVLSTGLAPDAGGAGFSLAAAAPGGGHATAAPDPVIEPANAKPTDAEPTDEGEADPVAAEPAAPPNGKARIAMMPLPDALPANRTKTLSDNMKTMLAAHGYEVVDGPRQGDGFYVLDADIAVEADGDGGTEKVGVDWTVSDALGNPLGKVSQSGAVARKTTDAQWNRQAILAAAAAAEGVVRIVARGK